MAERRSLFARGPLRRVRSTIPRTALRYRVGFKAYNSTPPESISMRDPS